MSDLILLNHAGEPVGGNRSRPANAAGFQIHGVLHKMYPQVNAACHAHSKYGKAWSTFAKPLDMINQDVTMFYGDAQAVYPEFGGVVLETEESLRLGRHLGTKGKLLILRNHGLLTVGQTVDEAAYLFTLAERSCEIQLQVDAAAAQGMEKKLIEPGAAEFTFKMTSDPVSASSSKWLIVADNTRKRYTVSSSRIMKWRWNCPTGDFYSESDFDSRIMMARCTGYNDNYKMVFMSVVRCRIGSGCSRA